MTLPKRKTEHLLWGRTSIPNARYFITLCTHQRQHGLSIPQTAQLIRNTWRKQHIDQDYILHSATIMPDHIHWLCTLGNRLTLPQIISKFKSLARTPNKWQRNYYEHRLRADDAKEPFSKYIFLNPYRKELLECNQAWPWWTLNQNECPEFVTHLIDRKYPPHPWLDQAPNLEELIHNDTKQPIEEA